MLGVYQNIIKINNNKNIKFFCQNFVGAALKTGKSVEKSEKHILISKLALAH